MSLANDIFTAANQTRGIPSLLGISESDSNRYGNILDVAGNFVSGGEASPETTVAYQSPIAPDVTETAAPDPEGQPAWLKYLPYIAAALALVAFVIVAGKGK